MKKSKFTEAQIVFAIKQFETGMRVDEISRQMGISQATFFNWKKKYGSMGVGKTPQIAPLRRSNLSPLHPNYLQPKTPNVTNV